MTVSLGPRFEPLSSSDSQAPVGLTADLFAHNIAPHLSLGDMEVLIRCNSAFEQFVEKLIECNPDLPQQWVSNSAVLLQGHSVQIPKALTDLWRPGPKSVHTRVAMIELARGNPGKAREVYHDAFERGSIDARDGIELILCWEFEQLGDKRQDD